MTRVSINEIFVSNIIIFRFYYSFKAHNNKSFCIMHVPDLNYPKTLQSFIGF